jgi:tetraacyldisaccharide 4'-kinase
MKINKPIFWDEKKGLIAYFFYPLSLIIQIFFFLKNILIKKRKFKPSIICVGNIYLGGTGKTPLSIEISRKLKNLGKKTAIVKKYYKEHFDEFNLINKKTNNLFINRSRVLAINNAISKGYKNIILDDGFQDLSINKDLSILCFSSTQTIGNGMTLPSGPLRESLNAIKRSNIIVINGKTNKFFEKKIFKIKKKISLYYSEYEPANLNKFKNKDLLAFAGIGNPNNFFQLLIDNKLKVKKKLSYPDHYNYSKLDLIKIIKIANNDNLKIVTTEKDYNRIENYGFKDILNFSVKLKIKNEKKFINEIQTYLK